MKSSSMTIEMKAIEQYFPVASCGDVYQHPVARFSLENIYGAKFLILLTQNETVERSHNHKAEGN